MSPDNSTNISLVNGNLVNVGNSFPAWRLALKENLAIKMTNSLVVLMDKTLTV